MSQTMKETLVPPTAVAQKEDVVLSLPQSTLILSRPAYRAGSKLVGTLLLEHVDPLTLAAVDVVVVGYARLDARWHKDTSYPIPPSHFHIGGSVATKRYWTLPRASHIFWTSTLTDLLPTPMFPEYVSQPPHDLVTPQPLTALIPDKDESNVARMEVSRDLQRVLSAQKMIHPKQDQYFQSYSFHMELPSHLPPTMRATSCRYSYAVLHRLRFHNMKNDSNVEWKECPFTVLTPWPLLENEEEESSAAASVVMQHYNNASPTPLRVVSHGDTVLCTLPSTDIYDRSSALDGQVSVLQDGATMFRSVSVHGAGTDCQSMRVSNPAGQTVTILTVVGAYKLAAGGRLLLQLDFCHDETLALSRDHHQWAPCYQVSAALQGEEVALPHSVGSTTKSIPKRRNRARQLLLATAHQVLDPYCTDRVCLNLLVPHDVPCSVTTDIVHIAVWCVVDLTVGREDGGHQNLRLEVPCRVGHAPLAMEGPMVDQEDALVSDEIIEESLDSFYTRDIQSDLRQLSYAVLQYTESQRTGIEG